MRAHNGGVVLGAAKGPHPHVTFKFFEGLAVFNAGQVVGVVLNRANIAFKQLTGFNVAQVN